MKKINDMNTLEYSKMILKKVSFDEQLLRKELEKALRSATRTEQVELLKWCSKELGEKCMPITSSEMNVKFQG